MTGKKAVKRQRRRSDGQEIKAAVDRRSRFLTAATAAVAFLTAPLSAQTVDSLAIRFSAMTAVTGYEHAMTDSLLTLLPGSTRDRTGNVTLKIGTGTPKRLISCSIDETGYVVGNITDDGYLMLRRVGGGVRLYPLFDQQLEGHRVTLFGRRGAVPGVVGVRSTHLTRGRPIQNDPPFTVDNAYIDVGATSRDQVVALGIDVLTPISLTKRPIRYGKGLIAAPNAGRRSACAALAAAALSKPRVRGSVVVAFTVQGLYADTAGLNTVRNLQGPFDENRQVSVPVKYGDTAVETVALSDVAALVQDVVQWIGGSR